MCAFRVSSPKQILEKILPHFDKYNLITKKLADYLLFTFARRFCSEQKQENK